MKHICSSIFIYHFRLANKFARTSFLLALFFSFLHSINAQDWIVSEVAQLPEKVSNNAVCEGFIGETPYLFSFGGIDSTKIFSGIHLRSYRYNTAMNEVLMLADLPDNMGKIAAAASRINDFIYIIGGYHVFSDGSEVSSNKVHRYDILNNVYLSDGTAIPIPIDDHVQAVWRDSLIYVVTGWSNNTNKPDVQIYNPSSDSWAVGTSTPNNNTYKSFGASGTIVGDTIYYFGGASLSGAFNIQNQLRKGIINPDNPTEISWSVSIPDTQVRGYRMAVTTVFDQMHWIGGSRLTYNFNGIAYNGSGGVPPANRAIYINTDQPDTWVQSTANEFPMDLRGIASVSDTLKFLAGGMLADQTVTNKIYRLEWDNTTAINPEITLTQGKLTLFPNPITANRPLRIEWLKNGIKQSRIEIFDSNGRRLFFKKTNDHFLNLSTADFDKGIYLVQVYSRGWIYSEKLIVQ